MQSLGAFRKCFSGHGHFQDHEDMQGCTYHFVSALAVFVARIGATPISQHFHLGMHQLGPREYLASIQWPLCLIDASLPINADPHEVLEDPTTFALSGRWWS